jgi:hypothetical protein
MYSSKRDHTFKYSQNTGTSALRSHVDRSHLLEYITLAAENGWTIGIDSVKSVMAPPFSTMELHKHLVAFIITDDQVFVLILGLTVIPNIQLDNLSMLLNVQNSAPSSSSSVKTSRILKFLITQRFTRV